MDLILLLAGMSAIVGALVLLVSALRPRRTGPVKGVAGALESIESVYAPGRSGTVDRGERDVFSESPLLRWARDFAARLSPAGSLESLQRRLDIAGNPGLWTPERIMSLKGVGLLATGAVAATLGLSSGPAAVVLLALGGAAAGFFLPDLLLYNAGLRRQEEFRRTLPDILDLLVVSVEAGLGFDAALSRVARNITGPLAGEFARLLQEMQIGKSREEALQAMAGRTSVEELRTFVGALVQASELGIPIGKVLREQAKEMRIKRRQQAEERAQKVSVKITFPVVGCILPVLFVIVLGPGIINIVRSGLFH